MNKHKMITMLNQWGINVPADMAEKDIKILFDANNIISREISNSFGKMLLKYNRSDDNSDVVVMLYQNIGDDPFEGKGFTAEDFIELTKDVDQTRTLDLWINSPGGHVWEGFALKTHFDSWKGKKKAFITGMAASVASWLPMSFDEIRAPRHAQIFIHDAWGVTMGDAAKHDQAAGDLEKTSNQIAGMYAARTKMSVDKCRQMMRDETLMTAEEAKELGFIDVIVDDVAPISNFTEVQLRNMKSKLAILNKLPSQGTTNNKETNNKVMRKQLEALLNKWGVKFNATDTDEQLFNLVENYKNTAAAPAKNKDGEGDDDGDEDDDPKNAPKPPNHGDDNPDAGKKGDESEQFKAATANMNKAAASLTAHLNKVREAEMKNKLIALATDGHIPLNSVPGYLKLALAEAETAGVENSVIKLVSEMPKNNLPGSAPMNIELGESDGVQDLDRVVNELFKPNNHLVRNSRGPENMAERQLISQNAKTAMRLVNRLKKYSTNQAKTRNGIAGMIPELPEMVGPLRDAWDSWAVSPRNANTMSPQLLRQVIMSEVMRAFRRQFASLEIFAHRFDSVPLEGTDLLTVPYYPLNTTASSEFTYANGYQINPNAQTLYKQILVGGKGDGAATPGCGRKYKALQFSAYEIRRQPWLDISKLTVMAGEQLAIDVRGDIIGANINAANFAQAIWTGAPNGFDHTVVGNVALQAAISAFWPLRGRNIVLAPSYYTNLAIDPAITPLLAIGTTDVLREGIVGGLYGFENIIHDPIMPVTKYIRGGDGTLTNGTDPNLIGFMAWPSAVLIATAPIMPPPGVLRKLAAYEQISDDQTGLSFTYQFWGDESKNVDNEIIECCYGSGPGELASLFRFTSQGN